MNASHAPPNTDLGKCEIERHVLPVDRTQKSRKTSSWIVSMRVAIIHPHLFVRGGGERLTKILATGLERAGDEVFIITFSLKGGFPEFDDVGKKVFFKSPSISLKNTTIKNLVEVALSIEEAIQCADPHVFVSMTEDVVNLGIARLLKRKLRTIQYVHFPFEEESHFSRSPYTDYYRFSSWFNKQFLWAADLIFCNSNYTQAAISRAWDKTAQVVYPGIDYPFMERVDNIGKPRENIVLYVGRFTKLKRQDFLVKIFHKVREKVGDARLILAGYPNGRHSHFLKNLLSLREEAVTIELNPSDRQLIQMYSSAKVYCHPRISEPFGLTPLEAMSQGAPVLAYNRGGIQETVIDGETGYLAKNDEEFARYIVKMLELEHSEWAEMQHKAVERASIFSPDSFVKRFRALAISGSAPC